MPYAVARALPSGRSIRAVSAPFLLATKLEAFDGRGRGDFLGSRDFADVIALVDGREELVDEIRSAPGELRTYLAEELSRMTAHPRFADGLFGALLPDSGSQARSELVIRPRLRAIVDA